MAGSVCVSAALSLCSFASRLSTCLVEDLLIDFCAYQVALASLAAYASTTRSRHDTPSQSWACRSAGHLNAFPRAVVTTFSNSYFFLISN